MHRGTPRRELAAILAASALAGCGSDASQAPGDASASAGAGAATSSTTAASTTATSTATSSTGTGGQGGGPNDSCARARPVDFGEEVTGDLEKTGDADFFTFQGKKGQPLRIDAQSEYLDDTYNDPDHIDTVITLFDAGGTQIAQNNDAIPYGNQDAVLLTMLPADGTYCARVAECWSVVKNPADHCYRPKDKGVTTFMFRAYELDPADQGVVADLEQGDDPASATALEYELGPGGYYNTGYVFGTFEDGTDVDVYAFTLPSDTLEPGRRAAAQTNLIPSGPDFDGSTTPIGTAYITTAADPTTHLVQLDGNLSPYFLAPIEPDVPHLLFIPRASAKVGTNDFYMLRYTVRNGNLLEVDEAGNDTLAGAELLTDEAPFGQGGTSFFIEGDLINGGTDVDHFLFPVPAGTAFLEVDCGAAFWGSGLQGLTATAMTTGGAVLPGGSAMETKSNLAIVAPALPVGATQLVLKLSATGQDPAVVGAFYRCGVYMVP